LVGGLRDAKLDSLQEAQNPLGESRRNVADVQIH
jgi:hypothetical protein